MRAVIQRVDSAAVTISGEVNSAIGAGLLVLLAVEPADTTDDIEWLSGKIARLRIFDDEQGVMNRSVLELNGEVLVVSQFTLFASTRKGNRPSYSGSAPPAIAIPLYEEFLRSLERKIRGPLRTGIFGSQMLVSSVNNGPVTIIIDTKARE